MSMVMTTSISSVPSAIRTSTSGSTIVVVVEGERERERERKIEGVDVKQECWNEKQGTLGLL